MGSPVTHATGMLGAVLAPMELGEDIHLIDRWDPARVLDVMLEADVGAGTGASVFLASILDHPDFTPEHARRIRRVGLGGAPVPLALGGARRGARHRDRARVRLDRAPVGHRLRVRRSGRASGTAPTARPMPGVEIRLVDDDGVDVPARRRPARSGRAGPTCASATPIPRSPRPRSTPTAGTAAATWASLDADGFLTITDRVKDVIIRGGENISAAEIEAAIAALPQVAEVAVVAAPDERLGEHACAVVRLAPGVRRDRPRRHHRRRSSGSAWPGQKWPEELRIVADFPRTASGKIRKVDLRRQLRAEARRHRLGT